MLHAVLRVLCASLLQSPESRDSRNGKKMRICLQLLGQAQLSIVSDDSRQSMCSNSEEQGSLSQNMALHLHTVRTLQDNIALFAIIYIDN